MKCVGSAYLLLGMSSLPAGVKPVLSTTIIILTTAVVMYAIVEITLYLLASRPAGMPAPLSPDDIIVQTATASKKPAPPKTPSARFYVQTAVTLLVLAVTLPFLVFAAHDHPWRDGAQTALGIAIGYWLPSVGTDR